MKNEKTYNVPLFYPKNLCKFELKMFLGRWPEAPPPSVVICKISESYINSCWKNGHMCKVITEEEEKVQWNI